MTVPIEEALSNAVESAETISNVEVMKYVVSDAEKIAQNLWPKAEKQEMNQTMSPADIGREAWRKVNEAEAKPSPRYIITRNEILENDRHPISGVWFERRVIELPDGDRVEGVFPRFESVFDAKIPKAMYLCPDRIQFKECNIQLAQEIDNNPELRAKFSEEQIEQIHEGIYDGTAPDGYVWHHDAEAGKLQLVDSETHAITGHTGGRSIWGGGSDNR
ncbi:MAG: HNH endonuclease [Lachnospiraceae bacterium]|nr:HNH endonuclease [Lachnospiraceae bacterium]